MTPLEMIRHDETRVCRACAREFELAAGEKAFYSARGLEAPRRCSFCREAVRRALGLKRGQQTPSRTQRQPEDDRSYD